ncbi:psbQ-like protein 3, chloroplastic [Salvia miltiorrhiza]|uniref:psbQ-like protein 3, chloroplastic n=1 Tax=Salvia miltiorrhiza TaxID=226208 RepID=UPI0025AB9F64|nr:psbQ-like protein 3, chloroplastic [Salvia miltiorrhiza]
MNALKFPQNQMAAAAAAPAPSSFLHTLHPLTKPSSTTAATRRSSILLTSVLLWTQHTKSAAAFDFRLTVPDQTVEEAESGIRSHAQSLIGVKDLLAAESWREAQKLLRRSSALLKQDVYTMIQASASAERPRLRKLYADLFNAVTRLDYAARDKDRIRVWESYRTILLSLDDILSALFNK